MTLTDLVTKEPPRSTIVDECVQLVDDEVKAKSGLSGLAIKGAYSAVKAIKPKFISEVVNALLNDWVGKIEPYYGKWSAQKDVGLTQYLSARSSDIAEDLLSVTDARAQKSSHKTVIKAYEKMRPSAKKNVELAVPKLAAIIEKHAKS